MGFVEETGAAQAYRDVRITTIYEGTTAIQSNDLVGRKIARDRGQAVAALIGDMQRELESIAPAGPHSGALDECRASALAGVDAMRRAVSHLLGEWAVAPERTLAVSVPFLKLCGIVCGGWLMARAAAAAAARLEAGDPDRDFLQGKIAGARFYAAQILPQADGLRVIVCSGAASVLDADPASL
jgi:hypothetical protein